LAQLSATVSSFMEISNKNRKEYEICLIFRKVIAKITSVQPLNVAIFRYITELICREYLTAI